MKINQGRIPVGPEEEVKGMSEFRELLRIANERLDEVNRLLTDPHNEIINELLAVVDADACDRHALWHLSNR